MDAVVPGRGFLPASAPLTRFPSDSELSALDDLGRDLPSLLHHKGCRRYLAEQRLPRLPEGEVEPDVLRLYYVRLGFLASGYVNQVGEAPATLLPRNLSVPLHDVCKRLNRPPILSYDGYALYNWKCFDPSGPIALGNIDTIQNFVHLYDEHWFILVHVEIEARAAELLGAILTAGQAANDADPEGLNGAIATIARIVWEQGRTLRRIPEKMDPALYYKTFRPYIRFFEGVVYEGVETAPMNHRGETGAQSSVMPALVAFFKIPHRPSLLTNHLADMRRFMPAEHRAFLEGLESIPDPRPLADKATYNDALEAIASFRETHLEFAHRYIAQWVSDPRGTGGTPYLEWLAQLIEETRSHRID